MSQFFGIPIDEWVNTIHQKLTNENAEFDYIIELDTYGYESYAGILTAILSQITMPDILNTLKGSLDFYKYVKIAHEAWCVCYVRWKNTTPAPLRKNHRDSINTMERNDRATTYSNNLKQNDLQLYYDIIQETFVVLSTKILETGMSNLSM